MNVKVIMNTADPGGIRADGDVRARGSKKNLFSGITARVNFGKDFDLPKGKYTYVFGIDRKGTFKLTAINASNNASLGEEKPFVVKNSATELRYFFEVP